MARRHQSVLTLILALLTVLLVSCGSPTEFSVEPPTYTEVQIQRIQQYVPEILQDRERMQSELNTAIKQQQWQEVSALIHGPLGQMLIDMNYLTRNLAPQTQETARKISKALFEDLLDIDQAAQTQRLTSAVNKYQRALQDFDKFLQLIPQAQAAQPQAET